MWSPWACVRAMRTIGAPSSSAAAMIALAPPLHPGVHQREAVVLLDEVDVDEAQAGQLDEVVGDPGRLHRARQNRRASMADLLDKRLLFVIGKGGVGRSTVAAALGLAAARRGQRTIVAEVSGQHRLAGAFGSDDGAVLVERELERRPVRDHDRPRARDRGVPARCRSARARWASCWPPSRDVPVLRGGGAGAARARHHRQDLGARAARAAHARGQPYDLVIVDAPATGHGVAMIRTPKQFADIARVGPIAHQGGTIHKFIADRSAPASIAVALPEEMPVNETLQLRDELQRPPGSALDRVIANGCYPQALLARATRARCASAAGRRAQPAGALGPARGAVRAGPRQRASASSSRACADGVRRGAGAAALPVRARARPRRRSSALVARAGGRL